MPLSTCTQVLVCGDIRGNVLLFPLKKNLLYNSPITLEENVSPLAFFKGAHGISTVCSVSIIGSGPSQLDIHSVWPSYLRFLSCLHFVCDYN